MNYANTSLDVDLVNISLDSAYSDDTKNIPFQDEWKKQTPLWEVTLKSIVYGITILVALIGNLYVILAIARSKRLQGATNNLYMFNLAVCDLLVTFMCMWVHLVDDVTDGWPLGAFFCRFNSFSQGE